MTDWTRLLRSSVLDVGAYSPGASGAELKARLGLSEVVRLNWNEDLEGPLRGVVQATAAELPAAWTYPEASYNALRAAVAEWVSARPDQVLPGHGIQALTIALVNAFLCPGDQVVIPFPTYGLYAQACRAAGASVHRVPTGPDLAFDLEAIAAVCRQRGARLVWICDPNNPTGLRLGAEEWSRFLDGLPDRCVAIVDEAYGDYIEPEDRIDRLADIEAGRPVIVLRTFSKIFALAGLRLGYALMDAALIPYVNVVQEPFNVNRAALAAGLASLERIDQLPGRRRRARAAREALVKPLAEAGIRASESHANFVLVELGVDDEPVTDALAHAGLLVRPGSELGLSGYVRVTTASPLVMTRVAQMIVESVRAGACAA